MAAEFAVAVIADAAGQRELIEQRGLPLAITAGDAARPQGRHRREIEHTLCLEGGAFAFGAEHDLVIRVEIEHTLIFKPCGRALAEIIVGGAHGGIEIFPVAGRTHEAHAIVQAAIQCCDVQPGIACEQRVAIEFVGILKGIAWWRIAVETAAGAGVIGAQIDARPIVDRHAHIPGGAEIVIAVGLTIAVARIRRRHAVGGITVDGAAIFDAVHCAVHRRIGVKGIERTAFGQRGTGNRRIPAAPGQHVDHTAHRIAAVKGGLRPAQNFDPVDIVGEKVAQKCLAIGAAGVVDANAVDQHQGLARRCATHADGGVLAHPAIAHRGQARHLAQRVVDEADLLALQFIRRDDGNGFAGQGRGLGAAGGGHHHGFEIGSGCGGCRPRQKHQSGNKGTFAHGALLIMGSGARARVIANRA